MLDFVQRNRFAELILTRMYAKISRLPAEYFESSDFHDRTERAFSHAGERMQREAVVGLYSVIAGVVGSVAVIVTLCAFHPLLSLVAVLAPLPTVYSRLIGAKITFRFKRDTSEQRRRLEYYEDLFRRTAIKEIKAMNAGAFVLGKWEECAGAYLRGEIRTRLKTELIGLLGLLVNNLATAGSAVLAV